MPNKKPSHLVSVKPDESRIIVSCDGPVHFDKMIDVINDTFSWNDLVKLMPINTANYQKQTEHLELIRFGVEECGWEIIFKVKKTSSTFIVSGFK